MKRKAGELEAASPAAKKSPTDGSAGSQASASATCQLSWSTIWDMYSEKVTALITGDKAVENMEVGNIYELLVQSTRARGTDGLDTALEVDPMEAMSRAKSRYQALGDDDDEKVGAAKKNWKWSPQSNKAREQLATHYRSLESAWEKGWRWYPEPDPKPNSHKHRFYPPTALLPALASSGVKARVNKKTEVGCGCQYLSSLETIRFIALVRQPAGRVLAIAKPLSACRNTAGV